MLMIEQLVANFRGIGLRRRRRQRALPESRSGQSTRNHRPALRVEPLEERRLLAKVPDLMPILVDAPDLSSQQQTIVVQTRVANAGNRASGPYQVQYFLSLDRTLDANDRILRTLDSQGNRVTTITRPSIDKRDADTWRQEVSIPKDLPQGTFYVGVVVDPQNRIPKKSGRLSGDANNVIFDASQVAVLKGLPLNQCNGQAVEMAGTPYAEGVNCRMMLVDGYPRTYVVYVPSGVLDDPPAEGAPVVVMHHGSSGNGGQFLNISGWREKADTEHLIAAFPTGAMYCRVGAACQNGGLKGWTTKWHNFNLAASPDVDLTVRPPGYPDDLIAWPANDVVFESQLLDDVQAQLPVDSGRMYASGFSNGAGFAARLAVELSDRFAAVAYVGGGLNGVPDPRPVPCEPIPVFQVVGTRDDGRLAILGLPPTGEVPLDPALLLALPNSDRFFAPSLDTFQLAYDADDPEDFGADAVYRDAISTQLTWQTSTSGSAAPNVYHFALWAGLVHHYPHGFHAQKNPNGFSAAEVFWEFFELYEKP